MRAFEFAVTDWLVRPFCPVLSHLRLAFISDGLEDASRLQDALARTATPCTRKTSRMTVREARVSWDQILKQEQHIRLHEVRELCHVCLVLQYVQCELHRAVEVRLIVTYRIL